MNSDSHSDPAEAGAAGLPGALVRHLKAKAQRLEATLKIGHSGLTPAFIGAVDRELAAHELIKVKLTALKEQKRELAQQLAAATRSHVVFIIGHVVLLYRRSEARAPDKASRTQSGQGRSDEGVATRGQVRGASNK